MKNRKKTWTDKEIEQWVDAHMEALVADLITLVNIRSVAELDHPDVPPYGKGCREVLACMLSMGMREECLVRNYDNYVGCISLNDEENDIGIWAHLDVVEEGTGWKYRPYDACVREGYVIGRGANDNKSSAVMGLYLLKFMKENERNLSHNIRLYLGTCEEQGMHDLDYFTAHYPCPAISLVPDSGFPVCCGERGAFNGVIRSKEPLPEEILDLQTAENLYSVPDWAEITIRWTEEAERACQCLTHGKYEQQFRVWIEKEEIHVRARGISCSAASPEKGVNALALLLDGIWEAGGLSEKGCAAFQLCREICADPHGRALHIFCEDEPSGPMILTATVAKLRDRYLEVSFISKYPITKNDMNFASLAAEACENRNMELKVTRWEKANYVSPKNRLAVVMTETYNKYMGLAETPFVMSGGTYARKLPNAFACGTGMPGKPLPSSVFPPGHGEYHQPDEAIEIRRIRNALIIYIMGLLRYCQE